MMEPQIPQVLTVLCMVLVVGHAAIAPEIYWKEALPNTPMPKAIINSLPDPELTGSKGTAVNVGKGGVHVDTKKGGGGTTVDVGPKGGVGVTTGKPGGGHTVVGVGPKGGVGVATGKPAGKGGGAHVGVGKGGVVVGAPGHRGKKPVYVTVRPGPDPFDYNYAASETQARADPARALFFLEGDMRPGSVMALRFAGTTNGARFLPREDAEALPFSSGKMPEILREFSVSPGSEEARAIEGTVKGCESEGVEGEHKRCATSLESLVDYATSTLGKNNVRAMSTTAFRGVKKSPQSYTITAVKRVPGGEKTAVCHKERYPYAVFYCHLAKDTSAYAVSLKGSNGSSPPAEAMAVCHKDTSHWNPNHLAFRALGVAPGSVPVCHFLPEDHIVWVPKN